MKDQPVALASGLWPGRDLLPGMIPKRTAPSEEGRDTSGSLVLILSAPYGNGHRAAAQAVAQGLQRLAPGTEAPIIDLGFGDRAYQAILKHFPDLWEDLHRGTSRPAGRAVTTRMVQALYSRRVFALVSALRPSCLVCTHPFAAQAAGELRRRGKLNVSVNVVITDFAVHPLWYHAGIDSYFVASENSAADLSSLGAHPETIAVTGIPIHLEFSESVAEPALEAATDSSAGGLGESRSRPVILISGGSLGLGPSGLDLEHLDQLGDLSSDAWLVSGGNSNLLRQVKKWHQAGRPWLKPIGFTSEMPRLMRRSSLLITKAGGLTCSEALACGLPMIIYRPLPGHEEDNARYLITQGAAARLDDPAELAGMTVQLLSGDARLNQMAAAARRLGRPLAALEIATRVRWCSLTRPRNP